MVLILMFFCVLYEVLGVGLSPRKQPRTTKHNSAMEAQPMKKPLRLSTRSADEFFFLMWYIKGKRLFTLVLMLQPNSFAL